MPDPAVLGLRAHTYWIAAVVLGGTSERPRVLDRRKLVFAAEEERYVFHRAAAMPLGRVPAMIDLVRAGTQEKAALGLRRLLEDLEWSGLLVRAAVLPAARRAPPDDLKAILRSHPLMHVAEGHFYREVVAEACRGLGLEIRAPPEHELPARLGTALGLSPIDLDDRLSAMGSELGPPWSIDQRLATMAAWLELQEGGLGRSELELRPASAPEMAQHRPANWPASRPEDAPPQAVAPARPLT